MRRSLVLCLAIVWFAPLGARADDLSDSSASVLGGAPSAGAPRERPPMRDIGVEEAVVSGVVSAGILTAAFMPFPARETPQWRGGILIDDPARDLMQLRTPTERELASTVSDALVGGLVLAPVFVDALLTAWLVRGDPELMGRMLLIDLQAHAFAQGLTAIFKYAVSRERPEARGCREDPERRAADDGCESRSDPNIANASFFSGHSSLAFTSAALICLHHTELGLLGPEGDAAACATGMALATTVGVLRMLADRHYASDVLIGAGVGLISGWLVPWLLHYNVSEAVGLENASATIAPTFDGMIGVQVSGFF